MNNKKIDELAFQSALGSNTEKQQARYQIWNLSIENGIIPASINDLYMARGKNRLPHNFTVPAMNIRGMAYDHSRATFQVIKKLKVGTFIFELARSEMGYTDQSPAEYASVIMAAALREGYTGPLCIQCDHFTVKQADPGIPKAGEIEIVKDLIIEAINSGFYNVDIDMSTMVDLEKPTEPEQQKANIKYSVEMAKFVRSIEPKGITTSLGGEIGHIGGVNSTVKNFEAFIKGFNAKKGNIIGISKAAVQTGSSHGGVVLPDGTLADVDVDFSILKDISSVAREKYGIGGTVQHGASTLPDEYFNQFVKSEALEVHLATGFQNIQMDHPAFPANLRQKIYDWLDKEKLEEKKPDWTDNQFHYKLRKKGWGQFKKECWNIPEAKKKKIRASLTKRFEFLFRELNVHNTTTVAEKFIKLKPISKTKKDFAIKNTKSKEVKGLAD